MNQAAIFLDPLTAMSSQLTFASASSWRTDLDHETLMMLVTTGESLEVVRGDLLTATTHNDSPAGSEVHRLQQD